MPQRIDEMIGLVFDDTYRLGFKRQWLELEAQLDQAGISGLEPEARVEYLRRLGLDSPVDASEARPACWGRHSRPRFSNRGSIECP